jgi:ribosomal protein S18 acetylase RimI-like enzyme
MSPPTIRACRPDDLPVLQRVRRAAFAPVFRSFAGILGPRIGAVALATEDAHQAGLLDRLCAPGSGHEVVVAERDGRVVGFAAFSMDAARRVGEIGLNAVHPDHAGQGVGTAMYRHVLARMREGGMAVASVGTGGDPSHAPARRAYAKAGFGPAIPSLTLYRLL